MVASKHGYRSSIRSQLTTIPVTSSQTGHSSGLVGCAQMRMASWVPSGKCQRDRSTMPLFTDDQVAVVSKATIDPVIEINREVRALGIT